MIFRPRPQFRENAWTGVLRTCRPLFFKNKKDEGVVMEQSDIEIIKKTFGLDPTTIGNRPRGFSILKEDDVYSDYAKKGYLSCCARDGGSNEPDCTVGKYPNYVGTECDDFDYTYRYYYFKPLEKKS